MNKVVFDPGARAEFLAAVEYYEACEVGLGRRFRQCRNRNGQHRFYAVSISALACAVSPMSRSRVSVLHRFFDRAELHPGHCLGTCKAKTWLLVGSNC